MTFDAGAAFMDILPRADGFGGELRQQLEPVFSALEKDASGAGKGIGTALSVGLIAAGTLAAAGIGKAISATQEWGSEVRGLQKVTGLAAEEASGLAATGDLLGISVDKLSSSFGIFDKNLVNGSANLEKYGITTRDATGNLLPFDELLGATADKFLTLEEGPQQAAFAVNVFGRAGRDLIPILRQGSDGLAELRQRAEELGLVMSQDDLDATKELSLAQHELDGALKGAGVTIGQVFIPFLTKGVDILTGFVGIIHDIPAPVLAGALGVTALTGAVAAGLKIYGFFSDTWRNLVETIDTGVSTIDAGTAAIDSLNTVAGANVGAAAIQAQTLAATELTTAVHTLSAGLGIELPAAETKALVSQEILNRSWARGAVDLSILAEKTGPAGAAGAVVGLSAVTVPAVAVLGTLVGVLKLTSNAAASTEAEIAGIVEQVRTGVRTLPQLRDEIARIRTGSATLVPGGQVVPVIRNPSVAGPVLSRGVVQQGITNAAELEEAERRVLEAQNLLILSSEELTAGFRKELAGITDLTGPFDQVAGGAERLNVLLGRTSDELDHFADISGVDASAIVASISKVVNDPKSSIEDVLNAYQSGIVQVKAAYQDWHDSIVDNFGGADAALSDFVGKQHVNFDALSSSLDDQRRDLRDWEHDFDTIMKGGGKAAQTFLNDMQANGLDSLGILDAVAGKPRKIRDEFIRNYNDVNKQTDSLASGIQKALDPAFNRIILQLKNVVRAIQGLPPIELNADKAFGTLRELRNQLAALEGQHTISVDFRGGGGHAVASGGIIHGASGFITQEPTFLVGESDRPTAFGRGAEAVIPLDDVTLKRLAAAISGQGGSSRPVGSEVTDLARAIGTEVRRALHGTALQSDADGTTRIVDDRRRRERMVTGQR